MDAAPPTNPTPAADAFLDGFRDTLAGCRTYDAMMDATEGAVKTLGGAGFIYWSAVRSILDQPDRFRKFDRELNLVTARGPTTLKVYEAVYFRRRGLVVDDPTVDHLKTTNAPFTTDEVMGPMRLSRRQKLNRALMHRFHVHHDLFVPLHTPLRYQALYVFALGSDAAIGDRLNANRGLLVGVARLLAGAAADFVATKRFDPPATDLSVREQECLVFLSRGLSNRQIADKLGIRERTVKFHVDNLMKKLRAGTRAQAVAIAARSNWLTN